MFLNIVACNSKLGLCKDGILVLFEKCCVQPATDPNYVFAQESNPWTEIHIFLLSVSRNAILYKARWAYCKMRLKQIVSCVFMQVFCSMHIVIKRCGVCGLHLVDLSSGSASEKCEEVFWSSVSVVGCLCNFMANCIVSMQQSLFTLMLPHKSPKAPINMSEML